MPSFDDSALAPYPDIALCALYGGLSTFNVKTYGAYGDGSHDDTVACRAALAAAQAAGGGYVYFPAGTYNVCPQSSDTTSTTYFKNPGWYGSIAGSQVGQLPIFVITSNNIIFIGDGQTQTFISGYCLGMTDPTNWANAYTPPGNGAYSFRFCMFALAIPDHSTVSGLNVRSMDISGNAGYTGIGGNGATPSNGWDQSHKCFIMYNNNGKIDNFLAFNCNIHHWRGEEIYLGGANAGKVSAVLCNLYSSNASMLSCSANVYIDFCTLGNDLVTSLKGYNGVENFCLGTSEQTVVNNSVIVGTNANGIAYLGKLTNLLSVNNTVFRSNAIADILLDQEMSNVTITNNSFTSSPYALEASLGTSSYPSDPSNFNNVSINNNTYSSTVVFYFAGYSALSPQVPINVCSISNNTVTNGSALVGGNYSTSAYTSWTISNNAISGSTFYDIGAGYNGADQFGLWTGNVRSSPLNYALGAYEQLTYNGGVPGTSVSVIFTTDLVVLLNNGGVTTLVDLNASYIGLYPAGFQVLLLPLQGNTTWQIKANSAWNNLVSNTAVPLSTGIWLGVNASTGLFNIIPVLAAIETSNFTYTNGGAATAITSAITVSDSQSTTVSSATVTIANNFASGEDVLSFSNTGSITGSWNSTTGVMTLSGSDTLANYQTALRAVKYATNNSTPSILPRKFAFVVNDGTNPSNTVWRSVTVSSALGSFTISGPSSGTVGAASTNFTVTPSVSGGYTGLWIPNTPGSGCFQPSSLSWSSSNSAKTFTYTPTTVVNSPVSINGTTSPPLNNSSGSLTYTVNAPSGTFTMTGPSTGVVNVASTAFTFTPSSTYTGVITPSNSASGSWSPSTLTWSGSTTAQISYFTPTTVTTQTLSASGTNGITDASGNISYTSTNALAMSQNAAASSITTTGAALSVSAATGGVSPYTYQWYRSTTSGFTPGVGNLLSGKTSLSFTDTGLSSGTPYYYVCVTTDSASTTSNSNQAIATTLSVSPMVFYKSAFYRAQFYQSHFYQGTASGGGGVGFGQRMRLGLGLGL